MASMLSATLLVTGACALGVQEHATRSLEVSGIEVAKPMEMYKRDCWQKRPVSLAQADNVPGAGIDKFEVYKTVEKDGFLETGCFKDYMYSYGDKFGDNKFSYKLEKLANVSIVHYENHVAKEDRKPMNHKVCFEFCRTVPNMGFFGIVNGRDCYCTPYYKPMESGSSNCDSVCEGEPTLMCGGKEKSTIFGMHKCGDTEKDLGDAAGQADKMKTDMTKAVKEAKELSGAMQKTADKLQVSFSKVGDSATTNLLQSAKVFSGDWLHAAEDVEKVAKKLGDLNDAAKKITKFADAAEVSEAEDVIANIEKTVDEADKVNEKLTDIDELGSAPESSKGAAKQYYPVMYFVDKAQEKTPQTCGGDVVGKPIVGGSLDACATACDRLSQECVGFSHYAGEDDKKNLCFLFSKFETAFYYTGCGDAKKFMFVQIAQEAAPFEVQCLAKFSKFEGTTLKPDASGKCKQCLRKLTKADRCYSEGGA